MEEISHNVKTVMVLCDGSAICEHQRRWDTCKK